MKMKRNLNVHIFLAISIIILPVTATTVVYSEDIPSAHALEKELAKAHREKLDVIQKFDKHGHWSTIMDCHARIQRIAAHGVTDPLKALNGDDCTTAKCQIMRLVHQISFNVQQLMKVMKPQHLAKIKEINEKIVQLRNLLRKYTSEDGTLNNHAIGVYF